VPLIRQQLSAPVDLAELQRLDPARYPLLLQSVAGGNALSRWDILFIANGDGLQLRDGVTRTLAGECVDRPFLDALDAQFSPEHRHQHPQHGLPFTGGWALYAGYELAAQIETSVRLPGFAGPLPDALALRCPAALLLDRRSGACTAVAEPDHEHLLRQAMVHALETGRLPAVPEWPEGACTEDPPERFTEAVCGILDYIAAGDVFQVNVSRAWRGVFPNADPYALYRRLCRLNPAPFAGMLQFDGWSLLSSSPERLVSSHEGRLQTRPIAGTRARLPEDDEPARIRELIGHPKERAEHVMLIDLERNDLSRVCEPGSIRVDELMAIESYQHVHHIVSNVSGRLKSGITPGQVIAAVFPGGTITGCPKVRCMQIIAELEGVGRGPYTGALGYLNRNGDMDLNILIRSLWLKGDALELRAGAGIVSDSVAGQELQETRAKAKGLLRALGAAE
jgi:anthranilate synthase component I